MSRISQCDPRDVADERAVRAALPPIGNPVSPVGPLVSLSAVTWDFGLVGRTRMLTDAWLALGQETIFVQVPSLRTALQRITAGSGPPSPRHVVRPWPAYPARLWPILPQAALRFAIRRQARRLRRQLDGLIDWSESTAIVISPIWAAWLVELPFARVIYDCIDDVSVHAPTAHAQRLCRQWEDDLLDRCTGAVVTAEALRDDIRRRKPTLPIALIRNGVDVDTFRAAAAASPRPSDVRSGARPVVGFVGALYEWIDWDLIEQTARAMPDCEFVYVGPHRPGATLKRFADQAHVRFLGARAYCDVPAYVQAFDVCWVPFDQSRVSRSANPVKIYEYLALGKPVVTTPVAGTESFGDLVRVGRTSGEIIEHLRASLSEGARNADKRVRFARANSWRERAAAYVSFVRTLADPTAAPLPEDRRL